MKNCGEYEALLDPFVDGELTAEEMERVQAHLEQCPECRAYVDSAFALRAGFPGVEDTEVPPDFTAGVMERIQKAEGRRDTSNKKILGWEGKSRRRWTGTLAALAACCAVVILVWRGPAFPAEEASPAGSTNECTSIEDESAVAYAAENDLGEAGVDSGTPEEAAQKPESRSYVAATAGSDAQMEVAAAMPAANDTTQSRMMEEYKRDLEQADLILTAEEAGDLLDGFVPVWEDDEERHYQLNGEECLALLEALERKAEWEEPETDTYFIIVTGLQK